MKKITYPCASPISIFKDNEVIRAFNVETGKKYIFPLDIRGKDPGWAIVENKIYIFGDFPDPSGRKKEGIMFAVSLENNEARIEHKSQMLKPRIQATATALGKFIYSLGGYMETTLTTCEKYSVEKDKWYKIPNLNQERYWASAMTFNERFIYVFAGKIYTSESIYINTVEKFDAFDEESCWKIINFSKDDISIPEFISPGAEQINDSEILIIGAQTQKFENNYKLVYNTIEEKNHKGSYTCLDNEIFVSRSSTHYKGKVYFLSTESILHKVNVIQREVKEIKIPAEDWISLKTNNLQ